MFNSSAEFAFENSSGVKIVDTHAQELSLSFYRVFPNYSPMAVSASCSININFFSGTKKGVLISNLGY